MTDEEIVREDAVNCRLVSFPAIMPRTLEEAAARREAKERIAAKAAALTRAADALAREPALMAENAKLREMLTYARHTLFHADAIISDCGGCDEEESKEVQGFIHECDTVLGIMPDEVAS